MKIKNVLAILTSLIIISVSVIALSLFTGCEPNVPEERNDGDLLNELKPGEKNDRNTDNNNGTEIPSEKDRDDSTAVEGDSPTANFGEDGFEINEFTEGLFLKNISSNIALKKRNLSELSTNKVGWGLGSDKDEYNRPTDALSANDKYNDLDAVFIGKGNESDKTIYLTFDEGYENGCTPEILDTLKSKGVKATFFVTYDYAKSVPELIERMIDEGHTVANHSYTHPSFPECSDEEVRNEINGLHNYIKDEFEYDMNLIRFPMGEFSEKTLAIAQEMNYTSVFWSFAYMDWNVNNQPDPVSSLEKIKNATHPGEIILLHAVSKTNALILGDLIDYWQGEGYSLGIIGEKNTTDNSSETITQL